MSGNQFDAVTRAQIAHNCAVRDKAHPNDIKTHLAKFNLAYRTYAENMRSGGHTPKNKDYWPLQ